MWQACLTPIVCVGVMDFAQLLLLFYWLQYRFIKRFTTETMQRVWVEEGAKQTEHRGSLIDVCTYCFFSLGSVGSVLYLVFTPGCKQRTVFFALPLRSNHSDIQCTIHIIESCESTFNDLQSCFIRNKITLQNGLVNSYRFDLNRFKCRTSEAGSIRIETGLLC